MPAIAPDPPSSRRLRNGRMTLADMLEKQFRPDLRFRGAGYLKAERVALRRITTDRVYGVVRDGVDYQTQLDRSEGKFAKHCSCEQYAKLSVCKHLWATILKVDEDKLLSGAVRPGYVPPFMSEEEPFVLTASLTAADDDDDDEVPVGVAAVPVGRMETGRGTAVVAPPPKAKPRLRPWEQSLQTLREELDEHRSGAPGEPREREIFYEIDISASRKATQLVVQVSQRQRRSSGQWGKLKPLKMRPGRFDELDLDDDRTILAFLYGGTADRSEGGIKGETAATVYRYYVPHELCLRLLPQMCQTGRLRYLGEKEKGWTPLSWDDAEPWELAVRVDPAGAAKSQVRAASERAASERRRTEQRQERKENREKVRKETGLATGDSHHAG